MKSNVHFDRWKHIQFHTWPFKVYKQYNEELSRFLWTDYSASKYVYKQLGKSGVKWTDKPHKHLSFPEHVWNFRTMKDWSDLYNERQNHFYLDCVMSLSSNLETFLSSIIALAIESSPGVLLGAPESVDGVNLLKYHPIDKELYNEKVALCVKGEWGKRKNCIKGLFGSYPNIIDTEEGQLEKIRKLRNKVGHSFGRDIEMSRDFSNLKKIPAERITLARLKKYMNCCYKVAKEMDSFLLDNFIGEYQAILAYHTQSQTWESLKPAEKAKAFKKSYGAMDQQIGKQFCRELIAYYESI